jgi:hypothetical protein
MTKEKFQVMLKNHDWFFERTEDWSKYQRGRAQRDAIWKAVEELGDEAASMYYSHRQKIMGT